MDSHHSSRREISRYYLGVDLGQAHDPTAIAVVRKVNYEVMEDSGRWCEERRVFQVGHLERVPLDTPYPAIVARVRGLLQHHAWRGEIDLAIDYTGVGRPVGDLFAAAGLEFDGVVITGGTAQTNPERGEWHVPKLTLISHLQALLHEGRLQIQKQLPEAVTLIRELQDFQVGFTDSGHMTFNARQGRHDDLVLAVAIAVWRAMRPPTSAENWIAYYRGLNEQAALLQPEDKSPHGWNFGGGGAPSAPTADDVLQAAQDAGDRDRFLLDMFRNAPKRTIF